MPGLTIFGRVGEVDLSSATSDWKVRTEYDAQYMEKYDWDLFLNVSRNAQTSLMIRHMRTCRSVPKPLGRPRSDMISTCDTGDQRRGSCTLA